MTADKTNSRTDTQYTDKSHMPIPHMKKTSYNGKVFVEQYFMLTVSHNSELTIEKTKLYMTSLKNPII